MRDIVLPVKKGRSQLIFLEDFFLYFLPACAALYGHQDKQEKAALLLFKNYCKEKRTLVPNWFTSYNS